MKKSPLGSIFLIVLVDVLGFTIILPLLPFYAETLGASPLAVGFLIGSYSVCQLFAGPVLGNISDKLGRKPVLLVSQLGTLIGFLILAFSRNLTQVFISRIIDGLTAGNLSVAQAYIADVTEPKDRAKSFGLIGIAFGLGFLVGPAITGILAHWGHQYPIFAAAFLSAVSIAATAFLLPSSTASHAEDFPVVSSDADILKNPKLIPLLTEFFIFILAFALFISGFALFAERRFTFHGTPFGAKEVGYVFAYVGLIGAIIQAGLIGRLVQIFGEKNLVKAGFAGMFLGFFILGWIHHISWLLVAVTISFCGSSILRPSLMSLITQQTGRNFQGRVLGMTQSLMSIAQIIAPVISGIFIQHRWLSAWAWLGAAISGCGLLWNHFGVPWGANKPLID